jgi:hypothetical protein
MSVAPDLIRTDEAAIAAIIAAMYASISGPAGPRDWRVQETLFHPEAHMMRSEIAADGSTRLRIMDRDAYRENTTPYFAAHAFYEVEIDRRTEVFGDIAQVWSTYEARRDPFDKEPERCGANSIQLQRDAGGSWRIISMLWDNAR